MGALRKSGGCPQTRERPICPSLRVKGSKMNGNSAMPERLDDETAAILARLATRASCRAFDGSPIAPETLKAILADGMEAPSSCNQQNWHFIVVTDPARKAEARDIAGGNPHFADCSALIYLCFQKGWTHGNFSVVQSVAGACYHMMLSAHLRGFRCIWNAGTGPSDAVAAFLGLPPTFEVQGALAIGRPLPTAPRMKAPRRPLSEVTSWDRFARPDHAVYPFKPAEAYPYFAIRNDDNPFAEWDPSHWTWDQIADFRGYSVWAKSPLAGVYVSRRDGDALDVTLDMLPALADGAHVVEVMPWGGTSTTALLHRLAGTVPLTIAELSRNNLSFIEERLRQEGVWRPGIALAEMQRPALPLEPGSADLVIAPQVLEHMPDPQTHLDTVSAVLRPGGHLVLSVRNMASPYGSHWREVESRAQVPNQGPFTPLDPDRVLAWVRSRFEIEEVIGIGAEATGDAKRLTGDEVRTGRLLAVRARRP